MFFSFRISVSWLLGLKVSADCWFKNRFPSSVRLLINFWSVPYCQKCQLSAECWFEIRFPSTDYLLTSDRFPIVKSISCQLSVDLKTGFRLVSDHLLTSNRFLIVKVSVVSWVLIWKPVSVYRLLINFGSLLSVSVFSWMLFLLTNFLSVPYLSVELKISPEYNPRGSAKFI